LVNSNTPYGKRKDTKTGKKEMAEIKKKEHILMEGNLLEYPIFSMERRKVERTTDEYIWIERDSVGKDIIERKFKINCVYGIPNAYDMNVFNGIMRIYVKNREKYKKSEAHFTIYELMKEIDLPVHDGRVVKRVRESLQRMANTHLLQLPKKNAYIYSII
jgi:hypothetical protein